MERIRLYGYHLRKEMDNHETNTPGTDFQKTLEQLRLLSQSGNHDMNRHPLCLLSVQLNFGISGLLKIAEVLPTELVKYPDDLPTSFVCVEKAIAKCISECLADVPEQKRDIALIQSFLREYKVVRSTRDQKMTVSLHKVHLILQDNYKGSSLCVLFDVLLAGFMGVYTKVITF